MTQDTAVVKNEKRWKKMRKRRKKKKETRKKEIDEITIGICMYHIH